MQHAVRLSASDQPGMTMQRKIELLSAVAMTVLSLGGQAFAQTGNDAGAVEAVIVTAQLRQQNAIEVPFALSTYSGAQLRDLGIQEFDALSAFVPGFEVQNQSPNNPGFVMRGITSDSGNATAEPRVSVFQDGVSISKSRGSYVELLDLERVEIAKGPQSTLYGRGALIGAVNLVQNKARLDGFSASAVLSGGNYG
jgi:iron complex outermembrane receptor protein